MQIQKPFRASLSKSQGREGWSVIFRHPLKNDSATGRPGRRVRKGLDTRDQQEAEKLVTQLNELLGNKDYWSLASRSNAVGLYDGRVVKIFYDDLTPESWDFFGVRDTVIPLPSSSDSNYRRVLFVGTTGSGKTTIVRQFLGTDPKKERFPSTSTAKTTIADGEIVIEDGNFRAVVTFMPRDQVRDFVEECLSSAVLAAYLGSSDSEIMRRLLNHVDQRFRLSYMLGTGGQSDGNMEDRDEEELDYEDEVDQLDCPTMDLSRTNTVLNSAIAAAKTFAERYREQLRNELGATNSDDFQVIDEIFEDNLEHLLREDEEYFEVSDSIMEEIERRFELLSPGDVARTTQGWPKYWNWECDSGERELFLQVISRFSSNYAKFFGTLLTPIVNGIRVAGPFRPDWLESHPPLVLLDGEGLGHTADSAISLPTSLTTRFDSVDAIVLVDNGAQPMQAAPIAVMRSVVAVGQTSKLFFCFTHFDQVVGDNLRGSFSAKEQHILASVENALQTIGEQLGPWAERALRRRAQEAAFFVGGIQEPLNTGTKRGSRSTEQFRRLLTVIDRVIEPRPPIRATAIFDKTDLVLAVQSAAETFHEAWMARLGRGVKSGVSKEHWARVKALTRRLALGWADGYDNLQPIADLHRLLQEEVYKAIQHPIKWDPWPPSDEEKLALFEGLVNRLSSEVMTISARRLRLEHVADWQEAYNQSGPGSSYARAAIISDDIYSPAAPTGLIPDRSEFLKEIMNSVEQIAPECSSRLQ